KYFKEKILCEILPQNIPNNISQDLTGKKAPVTEQIKITPIENTQTTDNLTNNDLANNETKLANDKVANSDINLANSDTNLVNSDTNLANPDDSDQKKINQTDQLANNEDANKLTKQIDADDVKVLQSDSTIRKRGRPKKIN
ncbi:MAG: hypothetical protein ACP5JE_05970, partial [Thermoplasmata archaeon]